MEEMERSVIIIIGDHDGKRRRDLRSGNNMQLVERRLGNLMRRENSI
jgi:hypothetical protein